MFQCSGSVQRIGFKDASLFNEHPLYSTCVCSEWARCNASAGPSALSRPFLTLYASVQSEAEEEERARRHPIYAPSSRFPPFAARPPARQRHDQYYAPELRHPNRPRDGLLLARSIFEAMVQLPFKSFSVCETGNQNEKLKIKGVSAVWIMLGTLTAKFLFLCLSSCRKRSEWSR